MSRDFDAKTVRGVLRSLPARMPGENPLVYEFGNYLADWLEPVPTLETLGKYMRSELGSTISPERFIVAARLALHKVHHGYEPMRHPLRSSLVGLPHGLYDVLDTRIPDIAEAVGGVVGQEFSDGVEEIYKLTDPQMARLRDLSRQLWNALD